MTFALKIAFLDLVAAGGIVSVSQTPIDFSGSILQNDTLLNGTTINGTILNVTSKGQLLPCVPEARLVDNDIACI